MFLLADTQYSESRRLVCFSFVDSRKKISPPPFHFQAVAAFSITYEIVGSCVVPAHEFSRPTLCALKSDGFYSSFFVVVEDRLSPAGAPVTETVTSYAKWEAACCVRDANNGKEKRGERER